MERLGSICKNRHSKAIGKLNAKQMFDILKIAEQSIDYGGIEYYVRILRVCGIDVYDDMDGSTLRFDELTPETYENILVVGGTDYDVKIIDEQGNLYEIWERLGHHTNSMILVLKSNLDKLTADQIADGEVPKKWYVYVDKDNVSNFTMIN